MQEIYLSTEENSGIYEKQSSSKSAWKDPPPPSPRCHNIFGCVHTIRNSFSCQHEKLFGVVQVQVQVHLFTLIQLQYNNNKEKKLEVKNRANYTLNQT